MSVADLKPGDKAIAERYHSRSIVTVAKVTATQIVSDSGTRYRKKDGRAVGGSGWDWATLRVATSEDLDEIRCNNLAEKLLRTHAKTWAKLGLARLREIATELKAVDDKTGPA